MKAGGYIDFPGLWRHKQQRHSFIWLTHTIGWYKLNVCYMKEKKAQAKQVDSHFLSLKERDKPEVNPLSFTYQLSLFPDSIWHSLALEAPFGPNTGMGKRKRMGRDRIYLLSCARNMPSEDRFTCAVEHYGRMDCTSSDCRWGYHTYSLQCEMHLKWNIFKM